MVIQCLAFWGNAKPLSTMTIYILTSNVSGYQSLHILDNLCYFPFLFIITILVCVKWYKMVVSLSVYGYMAMFILWKFIKLPIKMCILFCTYFIPIKYLQNFNINVCWGINGYILLKKMFIKLAPLTKWISTIYLSQPVSLEGCRNYSFFQQDTLGTSLTVSIILCLAFMPSDTWKFHFFIHFYSHFFLSHTYCANLSGSQGHNSSGFKI